MAFFKKSFFSIFLFFLLPWVVYASATDGTIDSTYRYAKFLNSNGGFIDFGLSSGNVHVTNSAVTGYAWGENVGWINLSPTYGGVTNTSAGVLSGYAWGEATGWINFAPTNGGVTINSSGNFSGYAWSQNFGWIIFDCSTNSSCSTNNFKLVTDWRSGGGSQSSQSSSQGGGAGSHSDAFTPPASEKKPTNPKEPKDDSAADVPIRSPRVILPKGTPPSLEPSVPPAAVSENTPSLSPSPEPVSFGIGTIGAVIREEVSNSFNFAVALVAEAFDRIQSIIQSKEGSLIVKTVSSAGVLVGALVSVSSLFLSPLSFSELGLIPLRLWGIVLAAFGLKKRNRPWGTVYDSVTKQPLDPAYVSLMDEAGKEIQSSITDLDGRYGFLPGVGMYKLVANKTNYVFPSKKLEGQNRDILYNELYFGESIQAGDEHTLVVKNIPMDPVGFDWNEFAKNKNNVMRFYSRRDVFMRKFSNILFGIGFFTALLALSFAPEPYNIIIAGLYVFLLILRKLGLKPRAFGRLRESSGQPLSFAVVRIISPAIGQIKQVVADMFGHYYCLVPPGVYSIVIEKKNGDESYSKVYEIPSLNVSNGIINKNITVEIEK